MQIKSKLGAVVMATGALTLSLGAGSALAATHRAHDAWGRSNSPAVFVQSDASTGNTVSVYAREQGGQLVAAGTYATGGDGGQLTGSVVDHLASQGSLQYDAAAHLLFAVNAGSNTVSLFNVRGTELQLRQVIPSGGSFPVSITVHGGLVYVLNALSGGNVSGFYLDGQHLNPIPGSTRALGLDPNATPQFVNTPGQVAFTPSGNDLLVSTKNNTNAIDVFAVGRFGQLAAQPVINSEPGAVPFALAFEGDGQVAVAEAGLNAVATFKLNWDGTLTQTASVATGQEATCWLAADGSVLFAGNAGSGSESTLLDTPGGLSLSATTPTDAGTVDAAVTPDGRFLYVQTGAAGIVDEFQVGPGAALTEVGSVTVPTAVGGEGITTS
ncbi:beta-propeller fold lactonase family protein [Conexibacter sp. S30A1]|uniref:lactonase family protein n=1 Tax=Conexibacter sp. S30A1 TaxID=2937800 RepID=UPI00200D72B8|nr:beta-propeller fold lactonase family protein [Conexibacter sp. S30A1]